MSFRASARNLIKQGESRKVLSFFHSKLRQVDNDRLVTIRGRMYSDAQFAGSSSVPAHVEMMGFLGIGNNPMVGATVAIAVDVSAALSK